jgi:hypothetical protein
LGTGDGIVAIQKAPAKRTAKGKAKAPARAKVQPKAKKSTRKSPARAGSKKPDKKTLATVDLVQARADFVRYFIEQDFKDATGAYQRAYSEASLETAAANSSRLLKDTKVQEALSAELEAVLKEKRRPLEKRILDTWVVRAFYDPTEILDLHGELKITEAQLRKRGLFVVIDSINKKLNNRGQSYLEYKLADRDKALDMLRQYIQMIEPPKQRLVLENISIGEPPKPLAVVAAAAVATVQASEAAPLPTPEQPEESGHA